MKAVRVKCEIWKYKADKNSLNTISIIYKPTCLQKKFHAEYNQNLGGKKKSVACEGRQSVLIVVGFKTSCNR